MSRLQLVVNHAGGRSRPIEADIARVLLAGYTGRDRAKVLEHVRELAALGVAPPARVPSIYVVPPALVTTESRVQVTGTETSGEAEFFLLLTPEGVLVGAGSDHTDRAHEAVNVDESKAMCPKPIARQVWPYAEVSPHWDRLELRSWVTDAAGRRLYQEGPLEALLPVGALLEELASAGHVDLAGHAVFGGTLPTHGGLVYGHHFEVELHDPVLGRSLTCAYDVVAAA